MEPTPLQLAQQQAARQAVLRASASVSGPKDGVVAVKVAHLIWAHLPQGAVLHLMSYCNTLKLADARCQAVQTCQNLVAFHKICCLRLET